MRVARRLGADRISSRRWRSRQASISSIEAGVSAGGSPAATMASVASAPTPVGMIVALSVASLVAVSTSSAAVGESPVGSSDLASSAGSFSAAPSDAWRARWPSGASMGATASEKAWPSRANSIWLMVVRSGSSSRETAVTTLPSPSVPHDMRPDTVVAPEAARHAKTSSVRCSRWMGSFSARSDSMTSPRRSLPGSNAWLRTKLGPRTCQFMPLCCMAPSPSLRMTSGLTTCESMRATMQ